MMKAVIWTGPRQMVYKDVERPQPGAQEVLVRVQKVGICGSELSGYLGHNSLRTPPLIMGHEFAGAVEALGAEVEHLDVGDAVAVNPLVTCGQCPMCRRGLENLCLERQLIGAHRSGAFADFVTVPAKNCVVLPQGLSVAAAVLAEPLACSIRAARLAGVGPATAVVILGAGAIGLLAITAVRAAGGRPILVAEVNPQRQSLAAAWGAEATVDARLDDPARFAHRMTSDLGADVVIDAVGSAVTRKTAIEALRPGGVVVFVGLHESDSSLAVNHVIRSEITLAGSFAYTQKEFAEAMALLAAREVEPSADWLEERPLSACADAFTELVDGSPIHAKIVLSPSHDP